MHIICLQKKIKQAVNIVERIIGRNLTLPILNNILLSTEKNKLRVSSTNLEIGINCWISGKIEEEGSLTVPAKLISNFINNLSNEKIELKSNKNNQLDLKSEKFRAKINGLNSDDFPIIPEINEEPVVKIKKNILRDGLNQVVNMASFSESRPEISGVYHSFDDKSIKIAATDSFRLAEKTISLSEKTTTKEAVIIPQRTIQEIIRIAGEDSLSNDDQDNNLAVALSESQVLFDLGDIQLVSKLIEGQYPDYQQLIPNELETQVIVDREQLIKNIKIASLFSGKINDIQLNIDQDKSLLEVFAKDNDIGENKSQLDAKVEGKSVKIDFNHRYLLDGLTNIYSDKIVLGFNGSSSPATIKPVGDSSYHYVVMPIKA